MKPMKGIFSIVQINNLTNLSMPFCGRIVKVGADI